jgi:hypothetical protein
MESRRVQLPPGIRPPFEVYLNGVRQEVGSDFEIREGALIFSRPLVQEGGPGKRGWLLGFWGIGTYKRNDEIDVRYEAGGQPQVARGLRLTATD